MVLQILSGFFSQTHSFLKNQTQAAHSSANKERISSMINNNNNNKNKHLQFSIFELGTFGHYIIEDTYWCSIYNKTQSDLLKIVKKNHSQI